MLRRYTKIIKWHYSELTNSYKILVNSYIVHQLEQQKCTRLNRGSIRADGAQALWVEAHRVVHAVLSVDVLVFHVSARELAFRALSEDAVITDSATSR